jgi:hypothetical protein
MLWQKLKLVLGSNGFPKGPLHAASISFARTESCSDYSVNIGFRLNVESKSVFDTGWIVRRYLDDVILGSLF